MAKGAAEKQKQDHWSSQAYSTSASFVPQLASKVLQYLDPQPTDKILDIGCGDGKFTVNFIPHVARVLGIDASPSMIQSAKQGYGAPNTEYQAVDCRYLDRESSIVNGSWDKVVSNAALHWILRDETTRLNVLRSIHASLKQGGTFVFEMGGHGNVAEVHGALIAALLHHGVPVDEARKASPWFFPSDTWMRQTLENIGFQIEKLELEYRPTKLTTEQNGGIEGWVRLMGAQMFEALDEEQRDKAVKEVCQVLETIITKEDGSKWLGYVRLRGVAVRT
ncbi:hypothetical protein AJ80_04564 [Polytolypa hystricis UAMH7299]|uniref:Methyltransferase domain-containing protein n=1 Tax=Polytolypa hystricis (strain UAMH7299) TaxID=1447883 RepID=A0A2B7YC61_POLH7|nr:hypothetical protein AJ80_04564 [Polytolypa hystricis UAMH7299]